MKTLYKELLGVLRENYGWFDSDGDDDVNIDHSEAITSIIEIIDRENAIVRSDLMWCLGKLRGLGYPAEKLEEKYGRSQ